MKQHFSRLLIIVFFFSSYSFSQPFWNAGEGPYGGTILDFAFNSQGHIYGSGFSGLFKSTNEGQDWEPVNPQFFSILSQVNTVLIDQMDNIYAGTVLGIYKSTDNGITWNQANNGLIDLNINVIELNSSGVLFTSSFSSVSRSTDGGANWNPINNGLPLNPNVQDFVIDPGTNEIFAATAVGVFTSTDNGDNWTDISSGIPANPFVTSVELSPPGIDEASNYLYAGTGQGVYRYDRLLQTWVQLATGLGAVFIYALVVNQQGDLFAGTATGIFRHLISANQWTQLNVALIFSYVTALAVSPIGHILAGEDWGGPLISMDNGNTWLRVIRGLTAYGILTLYYSHILNKFFLGSDAGFFKGLAALTSWVLMYPQSFPFFFVRATVYSPLGFLFAGTFFQGMWRSSDEGVTWQEINNGLTNFFITAVVINALGHLFVSTQGGGVFFSDNNGTNWVALNNGLTALFITTLLLSPLGELFAGTSDAGIFKYNFSTSQWAQLTLAGLTTLWITAIAVNSLGDIFAGIYDGGIFKLASGATAWIALGLAATLIHDLIVRRTETRAVDEIFAASLEGVFSSIDGGSNWQSVSGLEGNLPVSKFAADSSGGIYIAVTGRGAFQGSSGPNIINLTNNDIPENFILHQNYPNPFNPSTIISFSLPEETYVSLEIFNSIGEKLEILVSEYLPAGNYSFNWEADNLSTGVYLYRLTAENFAQTKKLLLMK